MPRGLRAVVLLLLAGAVAALATGPRRATAGLVLLGLATADLWLWGFPQHTFHKARPIMVRSPTVEFLASQPGPRARYANVYPSYDLAFNAAMHYGLYDIGGYDIAIPRNFVELVSLAQPQIPSAIGNFVGPFQPAAFASPVMDLLGVDVVAEPPTARVAGTEPAFEGPTVTVARRPGALPAAFVAPCWEVLPPAAVLPRMRDATTAELRSLAFVDGGGPGTLPRRRQDRCDAGGSVDILRYEPERVTMSADSEAGGVLVLTDTWFPGWHATVDGRPAPVLEVDHALRGVPLPPGRHRVAFEYRPASFLVGAGVTAASLLGVAAWVLWAAVRRRSSRRRSTERSGGRLEAAVH